MFSAVGCIVSVAVLVAPTVGARVAVGVFVGAAALVAVAVGLFVAVAVAAWVAVAVLVTTAVLVAVPVGVLVSVAVLVAVLVSVAVAVAVSVAVGSTTGVWNWSGVGGKVEVGDELVLVGTAVNVPGGKTSVATAVLLGVGETTTGSVGGSSETGASGAMTNKTIPAM